MRKICRPPAKKHEKPVKGKDALFGIWKDNPQVRDVEAYVDSLRGSSLTEFFERSLLRGVNFKVRRSRDTAESR